MTEEYYAWLTAAVLARHPDAEEIQLTRPTLTPTLTLALAPIPTRMLRRTTLSPTLTLTSYPPAAAYLREWSGRAQDALLLREVADTAALAYLPRAALPLWRARAADLAAQADANALALACASRALARTTVHAWLRFVDESAT